MRTRDIERTAEEIRLQFLNDHAGGGASQFFRMLWPALLNPNLSDSAKVIYTLALAERNNFAWSNNRMAKLANVNVRSVERAFVALETHGFIVSTHRQRQTSLRHFGTPAAIVTVAKEIEKKIGRGTKRVNKLEPTKTTVHGNSEQSKMTVQEQSFEILEPTKTPFRTDKNDGQPQRTLPQHLANQGSCLRGDGEKKDKQLDAIAQPEAAGYRNTRRSRREVRPW